MENQIRTIRTTQDEMKSWKREFHKRHPPVISQHPKSNDDMLKEIEKVLRVRDPEYCDEYVSELKKHHSNYIPQAVRFVEQMWGPLWIRDTWEYPTDHQKRLEYYFKSHPNAEDILGLTLSQVRELLVSGEEEWLFLRLEHQVGKQTTPPNTFEYTAEDYLKVLYNRWNPSKNSDIPRLLSTAHPHGLQLLRAVTEKYDTRSPKLPLGLQRARLESLIIRYKLRPSDVVPEHYFSQEANILSLVTRHGHENLQHVWSVRKTLIFISNIVKKEKNNEKR